MFFNWLKRRTARKQAAHRLYQTTRTQSRDQVFYANWGVADTMDGRFDVLCLYVSLLIARLNGMGKDGERLGQAVFDQMFRDIAQTLRETGVGDLGVPKHMARMMKAFNGRAHAYMKALKDQDVAAMETAIARNVYRAEKIPAEGADITSYVFAIEEVLNAQNPALLMRGDVSYQLREAPRRREAAYA